MTIRGQTRLFTKRRKRLGRWRYIVTCLSALIVFCTVYALILPAITMERKAFCGMELHEHTDQCFDSLGELICEIPEHIHSEDCYSSPEETTAEEAAVIPTEVETQAPTESVIPEEEPLVVISDRSSLLAATGASTSDAVIYKKQIEKLSSDPDDYSYRLHLTVDGSALEGSTTHEEHVGGRTGIVLIVDVGEDFTATTSDNKSKKQVIEQIVSNYLQKFQGTSNKITVITVRGALSVSYNDNANTGLLSGWNDYSGVSFNNEQVRYGTNYKAGLLRARDLINTASDNDLDKTSIVFITNSSPTLSVTDSGQGTNTVTDKSTAKTDMLNYLPTYLNEVCPDTDIHILDVEQQSQKHETPMAMGEYLSSAGRGSYTTASSSTELIDSFDKIIETIIPGDKTSNLSVSDTLSANVEYVGNPTATLTLGSTSTDVTADLQISGSTVSYSRPAEIDGAYVLDISFDIKTAEGLYKPDEGYPDTGDADTDYQGNATSSGQPGFYSNSAAGLGFTLNGTPFAGSFKHPVVQAPDKPQPKTQTINVTKHWADSLSPSPVQLTLYEQNGSAFAQIAQIDLDGERNAAGSYTYTFPDGEISKELYLVENDIGSMPLYSGETVTINLGQGDIKAEKLTLIPDGEDIEVEVTNWPKSSMPATGGIGNYPLIIGGISLALFGITMLIYKRKKYNK